MELQTIAGSQVELFNKVNRLQAELDEYKAKAVEQSVEHIWEDKIDCGQVELDALP